jgi:hypothetical protein
MRIDEKIQELIDKIEHPSFKYILFFKFTESGHFTTKTLLKLFDKSVWWFSKYQLLLYWWLKIQSNHPLDIALRELQRDNPAKFLFIKSKYQTYSDFNVLQQNIDEVTDKLGIDMTEFLIYSEKRLRSFLHCFDNRLELIVDFSVKNLKNLN